MMKRNNCRIIVSIVILVAGNMCAVPFVYVANSNSSSFSVIDQATQASITGSPFTLPSNPAPSSPVGVAISSDNQTAYMIDTNNGTLIAIDIATNNILSTTSLNLAVRTSPTAIAIDGATAYIGISGLVVSSVSLLPVNISNSSAPVVGSAINLVNPVAGSFFSYTINGLVISNHVAYVTAFFEGGFVGPTDVSLVYAVDLSTLNQNNYHASGASGTIPEPVGIAIDTATSTAYVVISTGTVQPFTLSPAPSGSPISVGADPAAIVIDSDNHYAYVTNQGDSTVSVIDLTLPMPSVVSTISGVSNQSYSYQDIALSTDDKTLYVATGNGGNNFVTPITVATRTAGAPIGVGGSAFALAVTGLVSPSGTAAPTNVVGVRRNNVFLLQTARYVTITWTASVTSGVTSYNIYNGTTLIGNVPATSPLTFNAFIAAGDNGNSYFVTAVSPSGESIPVPVMVA